MTRPGYGSYTTLDASQDNLSLYPETPEERMLTLYAALVSGTNPDGTPFVNDALQALVAPIAFTANTRVVITPAVGPAAGTGGTVAVVAGSNASVGQVTVNVGTVPVPGLLFQLTFTDVEPLNQVTAQAGYGSFNAANLYPELAVETSTNTAFGVYVGALTPSTTYLINYVAFGVN